METGRGSFGGERGGDILPGNFPLGKKKVENSTLPFPCIFVLESGQGFADSDSKLGHQESAKIIFLIEWCFYCKGANHFEQSSFFNEPATSRPKIKQLHRATIHLLDIMDKGSPFWLPQFLLVTWNKAINNFKFTTNLLSILCISLFFFLSKDICVSFWVHLGDTMAMLTSLSLSHDPQPLHNDLGRHA